MTRNRILGAVVALLAAVVLFTTLATPSAPVSAQTLIGPYTLARGTITLGGTNPSSATTGLTTIVACTVTNKRSTAPALDPVSFTTATAAVAGRLDLYAWKHTSSADPTLIASTNATNTVDWVCIGT